MTAWFFVCEVLSAEYGTSPPGLLRQSYQLSVVSCQRTAARKNSSQLSAISQTPLTNGLGVVNHGRQRHFVGNFESCPYKNNDSV